MNRFTARSPRRGFSSVRSLRFLAGACALLGALLPAPSASAAERYAVRAARIITSSAEGPGEYAPGVMIIRDGRVEAVGDDTLRVPAGVPVLDLPDATIMPGLVAARSGVVPNHRGDEAIGAGYAAIDAFDPYGNLHELLEAGITTMHLSPGEHRLLSGQGAVVRSGGALAHRVLLEHADLTINLGPAGWSPPDRLQVLIPPASDLSIDPPVPQRPGSRMTQFLALREAIGQAAQERTAPWSGTDIVHMPALHEAWEARRPLRLHADASVDLEGAAAFLAAHGRHGYIVGGAGLAPAARTLADAGVGLVYGLHTPMRRSASDIGTDPNAMDPDMRDLLAAGELAIAFAPAPGVPTADLRLAASTVLRTGLSEQTILQAITRIPAELLGVADRVGSLEPGKDADFIVLTAAPLRTSTHVTRVYVRGEIAWRAPSSGALIVHAGTIWKGPGDVVLGGSMLVEDGRIVEIGSRVAHPPHARVIDAGPDGYVTPGFIDARGHLGLEGDDRSLASSLSPVRLIGVPDAPERRVARSGITTQVLAPRSVVTSGSQVAAIRTWGHGRSDRIVATTAGVFFDRSGTDPLDVVSSLQRRLQEGRRYLDAWKKFASDLEAWEKRQAEGGDQATVERSAQPDESVVRQETDRITGVWSGRLAGMPLPEPLDGRVSLTLVGDQFEGQLIEPATDVEHSITGRLEGDTIRGSIEVDTGGMGSPTFEGKFTAEERIEGAVSLMGFSISFTMTRIERVAEARVVARTRRAGADGRPVPPAIDEGLEPLVAVLEGRIPLLVAVRSAQQIRAVVELVVDGAKARLILVGADQAHVVADLLREKNVGVMLSPGAFQADGQRSVHQGARLARAGVRTVYQSGSEDGARSMRDELIYAVSRGLSADAALASMTEHPAALYGLDDRIGRLEPGRDADMVIFSGHPMEAGSAVRRVIVGGEDLLP